MPHPAPVETSGTETDRLDGRRPREGPMRKRLGVLGVSIAAAALTVGVALPAAGSSRSAHSDQAFRVIATVTEVAQLDLGATGPSLGDEIVFTGKLLQGGRAIGHQGATCTTVSMQRHEA